MKILSGIAIIKDGKILLLHKIKHDHYELPGGKIDPGETKEEAAIREAKEEIGCDVKLVKFYGEYRFVRNGEDVSSNIFLGEIISGTPKVMEDVFDGIIWMELSEYEKYTIAPNVKMFIEKYKN